MSTVTTPAERAEAGGFKLGYRPALDGLRAVAVVLVMLHHTAAFLWPSIINDFATGGFLGVDIFFVLSGFLITVIVLAPGSGLLPGANAGRLPERLGRFYLRRVKRLIPALVGLLAFLGVCALVFHSPGWHEYRATIGWVLTYSGNWGILSTHQIAPEVAQTWSLAIEGQFYLVWPLVTILVLWVCRGSRQVLAGVALVGVAAVMAWRALAWHHSHNWLALYIRTPARFDDLLIGCLAGIAVSAGWLNGRAAGLWQFGLVAGLLAIVALSFTVTGGTGALYDGGLTAVAVLAAVVVLGALFAAPASAPMRLLSSRGFTSVGRWSYSLYLWHFPIFYLLHVHQADWNPLLRTVVGWTLAFGAAIASYHLIEQPFLRGRRREQPAA